jgi:tetratricopeptide (TPR) repeat protein
MKKLHAVLLLLLFSFTVYANESGEVAGRDTNEVIALNKNAYNSRLTNPEQTIAYAQKALNMASHIGYQNGIGEAYRVVGIGQYYLGKMEAAFDNYNIALTYFEKTGNNTGKAKVYNNMGNVYQEIDFAKALENFEKAKSIAEVTHDDQLIASLYLNMGNIYNRQKAYYKALDYYTKSHDLFSKLNNQVFMVQCLQNLGAIYIKLDQYDKAEKLLLEANQKAKAQDLNSSVGSINLLLSSLYIAKNDFTNADVYVKEGIAFAQITKNDKFMYDYKLTQYELERKRKNYEKALNYLHDIYTQDSVTYRNNISTKLDLVKQELAHQREIELASKDQIITRNRFWSVTAVAGLLLIVIALLVGNVKRKATTNLKLQELNGEVSRQKDNLDRINHHLEEIIDERTKDLQVKNKKLAEYSSYLSHQIRGPIATLKGLMNLEREGLVDQEECITMMNKCVSEIDEKIMEMSDMLHDIGKTGF